jgi:hypothetical protein
VAYLSLIQQDWHAEVFRRGDTYQVVLNVGHDAALGVTYSIVVGLAPQPGDFLEYFFNLVRFDETNDQATDYFSGKDT